MEWNNELEELAAEAAEELAKKLEGAKPEPVTPGTLSEIVAALQEEDDDEDPDDDLNTVQLVKSIKWLRSKNISAEDLGDFVKYICE